MYTFLLFLLLQAGASLRDLLSAESSSPRLVIYVKNDVITDARVVHGKIQVDIPDPTVAKSVTCLMSSYYAWRVKYPPAYEQALTYLDCEILEKSTNLKGIEKFIRDVRNVWEDLFNCEVENDK